ncbi:hypothetical protein Ahy_A07g031896 isoform B [Arachis hypogaea]|uniref:Uncharacterized protein n=1 Tax=Arachis hypogaea TaxID=3818 RepID=A0A445C5D0_ARAHY|nr:hypothetical protein Ahy_A07g031896 isoform B [Arachis hypogaea]
MMREQHRRISKGGFEADNVDDEFGMSYFRVKGNGRKDVRHNVFFFKALIDTKYEEMLYSIEGASPMHTLYIVGYYKFNKKNVKSIPSFKHLEGLNRSGTNTAENESSLDTENTHFYKLKSANIYHKHNLVNRTENFESHYDILVIAMMMSFMLRKNLDSTSKEVEHDLQIYWHMIIDA